MTPPDALCHLCIGDYMTGSALCSTGSYLWGMFLEDILLWGYIYLGVEAVLRNQL